MLKNETIFMLTIFLFVNQISCLERKTFSMIVQDKNNEIKADDCLKDPGLDCRSVLKVLMEDVELKRIVGMILKNKWQNKKETLKTVMKSYFQSFCKKKLRQSNLKTSTMKMGLNHIFKII